MNKVKLNFLLQNNDLRVVGVAAIVILSAQLGFALQFGDSSALSIWPPVGVAFALVVLMGYRIWPGIVIGGLITYSISFINQAIIISVPSITAITIITVGIVVEILIGYFLYQRFIVNGTPYNKTGNTFRFLGITMIVATIGALTHSYSLQMIGAIEPLKFWDVFLSNYMASVSGMFLFTNLILAWVKGRTHWKYSLKNLIEAIIFTAFIGLIFYLLSNNNLPQAFERSFPFLIIPFLLWAAFSMNIQITSSFLVLISLFSVYITKQGGGPFLLDNAQDSMFLLQIFIAVLTVSSTVLSASVFERTEAKKKVEDFNRSLEDAVVKRTKELDSEIEARKNRENEIRNTNKELMKINTELDNFVYKVSHDLRAPISSILGLVNIAKKDQNLENMSACIEQIEKSAITQDNFIKDIIELSKNSRLEASSEEIDFKVILDGIYEQLKYSYNGRTIKPNLKIEQDKPFLSDPVRLKVIFNNLISNSIKYSKGPDGKIDVNVNVSNGHVKIEVKDDGLGIKKEHQDQVWDMFYRATDENAGSGLGLYIVKETVAKLQGKVALTSEENKGTLISLTLPNNDS